MILQQVHLGAFSLSGTGCRTDRSGLLSPPGSRLFIDSQTDKALIDEIKSRAKKTTSNYPLFRARTLFDIWQQVPLEPEILVVNHATSPAVPAFLIPR